VGAILTQSVAWGNVEIAIRNLRSAALLGPEEICRCDLKMLARLVRSTRFFNQKAQRLQDFCDFLMKRYDGDLDALFDQRTSEVRNQLLGLKGIGPETADSILLYAGQHPVFVVDAYTRRIFSRLGAFAADASYSEMQSFFVSRLPSIGEGRVKLFNEYHALIDRLGGTVCTARDPECEQCPLDGLPCPAGRSPELKETPAG